MNRSSPWYVNQYQFVNIYLVTILPLDLIIFLSPFQSNLPADPDVEFEAQSPYQSDLPAIPDADLEPQSPANQSDLPVEPALDESSLAESPTATVRQNLSSSFAISFQVINDCTNKGRPKLIDSRGFSYGIKRRRANATDWICTIRPKVNIAYRVRNVFTF